MAIIKRLSQITPERDLRHTEVEATYAIVHDDGGEKCLQIDTYGSSDRKFTGKKSQSLRFSAKALEQLSVILAENF